MLDSKRIYNFLVFIFLDPKIHFPNITSNSYINNPTWPGSQCGGGQGEPGGQTEGAGEAAQGEPGGQTEGAGEAAQGEPGGQTEGAGEAAQGRHCPG